MANAEQKKEYHVSKAFKGVNTKANRTAIDPNEFAWLENAQPIGFSNLKITPGQGNVVNAAGNLVTWTSNVSTLDSVNLGLKDYLVAFQTDGSAQYFNLTDLVKGNIASANKFSTTGIRVSQWKNERLLIMDPAKGYFTWDSNNVNTVGSVGAIGVVKGGTGFNVASPPSIIISGPDEVGGIQANAQATVVGTALADVTLIDAGLGYTNAANLKVTIAGTGANAQCAAQLITFAQNTVSLIVTNPGDNYTNAANVTVTITGGGGTNAAGQAIVSNGQIIQIITTNPGSGYSNTANISVAVTGGGGNNATVQAIVQSSPNVDISSFSGRVWPAFGRTVATSAAGTFNDFSSVSATTTSLDDSTLHGNILGLLAANNFLYIFGDDSINVFSDVRVTSSGTTLFTNTNVSASIGSKRPNSLFPYFRSVLFMNDYGIYALVGSTTSKLSDPLDGIFPLIDFTKPVTGGQVLLNNILCAAFNFYYNDPVLGLRPIQAVFFEKKWFFTSQGTIDQVTSVPFGGKVNLYGTAGKNLVQLYSDATALISSTIKTALNDMDDPIRDKQAIQIGIEATLMNSATFNITVDSEKGSAPAIVKSNTMTWTNNVGGVITWKNNSLQIINWSGGAGYSLYTSIASQWGKYLGMTATSTDPAFTINTFEYEYEKRARF